MADNQLPVTRLPRLDSLAVSNSEASVESACKAVSRPLDPSPRPARYNGEPFTSLDHHRRLLHSFAAFLQAFTGDDDVSFDFALVPNRNHHPTPSYSGVAALQSDGPLDLVPGMAASDSDFGIVVAESIDTPPSWDSQMNNKPFVVVIVDGASCTVRWAADRIPHRLADPIVSALLSHLSPAGSVAEAQALSVLNHPPIAEPPDFESLLGLRMSVAERQAYLLHSAFSARAKDHPDRPAIDFLGQTGRVIYSYKQVDDLSSALARRLRSPLNARGCRDRRHIAALLYPCPELYVAWLGVLKAGCTFCPIPVETPSELLSDLTDELEARVIMSLGRGPSSLEAVVAGSPALEYIDLEAFLQQSHAACPQEEQDPVKSSPGDVAYIMYTSGSTGKPKGVQVTHIGAACVVAANVEAAPAAFRHDGDGTRWFQFTAPTFDASVAEIFMTLSVGGTLCACDRALVLTDPEAAITALGADSIMTTPSMATLLTPEKVPSLRHLWSIGEALNARVIENFAAPGDPPSWDAPRNLVNTYGPTEATINCTVDQVSRKQRGSVIGPVVSTCSVVILDPSGRSEKPVPVGFSGELAIGGPQVSAGYLKRPEQNAQSFVDVPPFGRLYRTGDRARIVEGMDGALTIDFLGRISSGQIKITGKRVELGEIEAAITCPSVAEVAVEYVSASSGETGNKASSSGNANQLIAVVVPRNSSDPETLFADCQSSAAQKLQPFMRPSKIYMVSELPRTVSDKLDRKALQRMCLSPAESGLTPLGPDGPDVAPPETEAVEAAPAEMAKMLERVASAVSRTVPVAADDVTPSTTLLALGLDSLHVVQLLQRARDQGLPNIKFADVLSCRSVLDLVRKFHLVELRPSECADSEDDRRCESMLHEFQRQHHANCILRLPFDDGQVDSILPATTSQAIALASFVLSSQSTPASEAAASALSKAYIHHSVLEVASDFDTDRLIEAWCSVLSRYDMMRTVFVQVDDELTPFAQCILSKDIPEAQIKTRRYLANGDHDCFDRVVQRAQREAEDAITLEKPPRSLAVVLSPNRNAIVFSMLHSIFDGASLRMLLTDVEREYFGEPVLARDGVLAAVKKHFSEDREGAASFWKCHLQDSTPSPFPCIRATVPGKDEARCGVSGFVSELTMKALKEKAARLQSSPLSVLQAAWAMILFAYTGERDVIFGNVVSDRFTEEMENCAAPTLAVHPLRVVLDPEVKPTNGEMAVARTEGNSQAFRYLHAPISSASFDTTFAFQHFAGSSGEDILYLNVSTPAMDNDQAVMIEVYETRSGKLEFVATYKTCLVDNAAAQVMLADLASITRCILDNPQEPFLGSLYLPADQLAKTTAPCQTATEPDALLLQHHFEKWVREKPDASALAFYQGVDDGDSPLELTYKQLDQKAMQVAELLRLRLCNTTKPHIVPICMEKCPELYVAILGVLKAGAAWCPIDPHYPPARQQYLMERATAGIVLVAGETVQQNAHALPPGVGAIEVHITEESTDHVPDVRPQDISQTDLAYVIFTSGTTGVPKGVPITHEAASSSITSFVDEIARGFAGGPVRYLQFANFTFDVFVRDLFAAWKLGGMLVSATREILLGSFAALANKAAATHASMTPTFASTLRVGDFETLQVTTMGGETLPQALADEWKDGVSLFNIYGPAETAINVTARRVTKNARSCNIGGPLPTVDAWVTRDNRPLLSGALGELIIAGRQLSPGYWTDETDEARFVWNPVIQRRVYRTGDMVRQLSDGSFDFVGRNDNLVKIRGMRVELSEIASVCSAGHAEVVHAEVLLASLPESTERSVVCFLDSGDSRSGVDGKPRILRDEAAMRVSRAVALHAASQLPQYMVPDVFVVMSLFPRTRSAKVDRRHLLDTLSANWVDLVSADAAVNGDASVTDSQWNEEHGKVIDAIAKFAKIRGRNLAPATTLAELGLDSIAAIKLSFRLKAEGHDVSAVQILACRSIGEIVSLTTRAKGIVGNKWREAADQFDQYWRPLAAQVLADRAGKFKLAPTTPMQDGVLVESLREPLSYWGTFSWTLSPSVDLGRLHEAWGRVVELHEILRAGFLSPASFDISAPKAAVRKSSSIFIEAIFDEAPVPWAEMSPETGDLQAAVRRLNDDVATKSHSAGFAAPPWQVTALTMGEQRVMVLTMHHSLYDGDMIRYLMSDLNSAYNDLDHQTERCQVQEAVGRLNVHQNSMCSLHFWTEQLKGFDDDETEADMEPAKAQSKGPMVHRTTEMRASLSKSQLSQAAADFGVSSFNSLIRVAYGSMLAELSETDRALFAEIRSERVLQGRLTDAMAPLVSVYPVPFTMSGNPAQMVQAQADLASRSIEYGPMHARQVRRIIHRRADETLYPAVFVFHPFSPDEVSTTLWREAGDLVQLSVDHAFALNVFETLDDGVRISLAIDETIMTCPAQDTYMRELDALLANMVLHPGAPSLLHLTKYFPPALVSMSEHVVPEEYRSPNQTMYHIELLAEQHPDWKAVEIVTEFGPSEISTVSWTFEQLNRAANRVAHFIRHHSLRGRTIGMSLDRDLTSFAVILGILKSGNVYVPVEMSLPSERQNFILQDSGAAMFFTSNAEFELRPPHEHLRLVTVGSSFLDSINTPSPSNPVDQGTPELDAYFIYTSGSTGTPKGVRVSRSNLSYFLDALSESICTESPATRRLGGSGKYLCLASRAFDVHIGEMFLAWRHGMCAVTGERLSLLDNLSRTLRELRVTHASFVPSLLDQTGLAPSDAPDLVYLSVGGEKMTPQTQQVWASSERVSLINVYGPTEATICCCSARLRPESDIRNIGKPVGDTCAHVLVLGTDMHVKKGMPGELAISGRLVASGYHNRPDATGFCAFDGQPTYRTGDIVRMEPDGSILFLGRKDDQVKVRGQRLELGEVSQAVRAASTQPVDVATLLLRHTEMPRQSLVSFVAASGQAARRDAVFLRERFADVDGVLKRACQASLPAYMVPDFLVPVSALPLTETAAKTDNKLLANIFRTIPLDHLFVNSGMKPNGVAAPARELDARERQIVAVIASVIPQQSQETVTPDTSVFRLGVDSITAVSISFRLRRLGFGASVAQLLRNQSIEQLVASISTAEVSAQDREMAVNAAEEHLAALEDAVREELVALSSPVAQRVESIWPCLPLQEILVAHSLGQGPGGDAQYVGHIIFELNAGTQVDGVRRAWEAVVSAVAILRTCFHCRERDIVQVVLRAEDCRVSCNTISGKPSELGESLYALRQDVSVEMIANLHHVPPMRLTLASADGPPESQQPSLLMLSMHHGLYDMNSLALILADFETAYAQGSLSERPSIAPLMRHAAMQSRRDEQARQYWEAMLADRSQAHRTQPWASESTETSQARRVFKAKLGAMESLCVKSNLTLAGLIQGLFAYVLAQAAADKDVMFGVVLSGRSIDVEGIDEIRAPCIATIPQRLCLQHGTNSIADVVSKMQKQLFHSMEHQYTSLRSISSWLGVSGPLFSSIFSFIRAPASTNDADSQEKALKYVKGHMSLDYALVVECEANPGEDSVTLQAQSSLSGSFEDLSGMLEKIELLASALLQGQRLTTSVDKSSTGTEAGTCQPLDEDDAWSPLEGTIRDTIAGYCGMSGEQINKSTPFIRFGIDSITTIRFAKLLRERGVQVSGADVVRNPSIKDLARHVKSTESATTNGQQQEPKTSQGPEWSPDILKGIVSPSVLRGIECVYPLTPLQAGMVTATLTLHPKLYSYHHALSLPLDTDLLKLKAAWYSLLRHHDILRTSFFAPLEKLTLWAGAVHKDPIPRWKEVQTDKVEECLQAVVAEAEFRDISSFSDPPVAATIIQSPSELILVASLHHSTYDVVSINFIFRDLWSLYSGSAPPLRRPFHDAALAIWSKSRQSMDFWTSHLAGYQSVRIPLTDEEEARRMLNTAALRIVDDVAAVEDWCIGARVTVQSLVFLALGKAVCSLVGARDVVLGQVLAARVAIDEADEVAGPMLNTLPFRLSLPDATASNLGSLQGLQEFYNRSLDHQHGSLMHVQRVWRGDSALEEDLFDTLFVFQKQGEAAWSDETPWRPYQLPDSEQAQPLSQYRLNVEAEQRADGSLVVTASSKMAKKKVEELLDLVAQCLKDVMASPDRLAVAFPESLADLPLSRRATAGEQAQDTFQQEAIDGFFTRLVAILCSVTGSPVTGITTQTSIYSIGIDSIMAIRVASACRKEGIPLSTADIIRHTKIGRLCEAALAKSGNASEPSSSDTDGALPVVEDAEVAQALSRLGKNRDVVEEVLPVLPGQEYFLCLWLRSGKTKYESTWVFRAQQRLDASRLQRAWSVLRRRFSTLRSCFVAVGRDRALQVALRADAADARSALVSVESVDEGSTLEETVRERVRRAYRDPSSLYQPPARIGVIQGAEVEGDAIIVTLHHATYDGWSMGLLIAELSQLYEHPEGVLKPRPSYSRFVRETCASAQSAGAEAFWREALGSCEPTLVGRVPRPDDAPPPLDREAGVASPPPERHSVMLDCPGISVGALEAAARKTGVTPQTIIVAAFAHTLCVTTGSRAAVFGYFTAGRSAALEDMEALAGPTVNMLPLAVPAHLAAAADSSAPVAAQRLGSLQEALGARTGHEQSRLRDVLRWAGRDSCSALFNAHLNILWNDEVRLAPPAARHALLRPWTLGAQSDFVSREPVLAPSAVDALDVAFLPARELHVDIGPAPGSAEGRLSIGAGCDAAAQGADELLLFLRLFRHHVSGLLGCLSS